MTQAPGDHRLSPKLEIIAPSRSISGPGKRRSSAGRAEMKNKKRDWLEIHACDWSVVHQ